MDQNLSLSNSPNTRSGLTPLSNVPLTRIMSFYGLRLSMASPRSLWRLWSWLRSVALWVLHDLWLLVFWPSVSSGTLSGSLARRFLAYSRWAVVGGLGGYLSITGVVGDQLRGHGLGDINQLERAARVFPYDRFIRTQPAYFVALHVRPNDDTVSRLQQALRTDPFCQDLLLVLSIHAKSVGAEGFGTATESMVRK